MSQARRGSRVKIFYTGKLKDGRVFETNVGNAPLAFTVGKGKVIRGFENAVMGMKAGETKTVTIKPVDAYGAKDQTLVWHVPQSEFPDGMIIGIDNDVAFTRADGVEIDGRITDMEGDLVTIDGNHPLAGRNLTFEITLIDIG
ncbi:MAG: peptidylprolyl isomerase [Syntrophales bacterium]|nr:peptidylprolyl isomerase [Syntrophales bacterium]NLN59806.1 peptidylprolyl isomerase [Deltaproteobacteria bacterium]